MYIVAFKCLGGGRGTKQIKSIGKKIRSDTIFKGSSTVSSEMQHHDLFLVLR